MNWTPEIIFALLVVVVSIISSVASAVRKGLKKNQRVPQQSSPTDENPWEAIFREITGTQAKTDPPRPQYKVYEEIDPDREPAAVAKAEPIPATRTFRERSSRQPITGSREEFMQNEHKEDMPATHHLLDEFDLEKAVIFSELLKPKYDE